jgi:hypothetical protein
MPVPYVNIRENDLKDPTCSNLNLVARTHTDEINRLGGLNGPVDIVSGINAQGQVSATQLQIGAVLIIVGFGSPEGNVTAPVGSLYLNQNGGAGTTLFVKESQVGTNGWVGK